MAFGFRRLKLSQKLSLLFGLPLLLSLCLVAVVFGDNIAEHAFAFALTALLLITCGIGATLFIQRLTKAVESIATMSRDLASGRLNAIKNVNALPETAEIGLSITLAADDVIRQTQFAEHLRSGNLDATYTSRHDKDILGKTLINIKDNLIAIRREDERRNWASDGLAKFVEVLQSAKNLKSISNDIIINLVRIIKANQGAIYLVEKNDSEDVRLELQACYAYNRTKHLTQSIALGEGILGQAFLEQQTNYLKDVPDHFVRITSGLGEANPRNILIVPLKMNETVVGLIELASFHEFNKHEILFVEKIGESIAFTVSTIRTNENTKRMVDALHGQTELMRAQEEELRQNQEELQATQETISRKYDALFKKLGDLNYQSKFDQLKSITSTKKRNVEYYFDIIRNQILTFSEDRMIIEAVKAFKGAFYKIDDGITALQQSNYREKLSEYYKAEFIPRLKDNTNFSAMASEFIPEDPRVVHLQHLYISGNIHPTGKKSLLNSANDGSDYSRIHGLYHPILRNFLEKFGYYDIFLLDAETGDMVYSVFKEVDFATSLLHGKYHQTNFGKVVKNAIASDDKNFVQLIDFEPYDPSYHAPASFIACPVYDAEDKIGIIVFQMPINKINQILTGNNKWREDGLGDTGETFMVGGDYKLRSISRQLIENMDEHVSALKKLNYDSSLLLQIRKMETSILMEEIKLESSSRALAGSTGTTMEKNSLGIDVLSAYSPLEIPDVHWIIMSSMTEEEASLTINSLRDGNFE